MKTGSMIFTIICAIGFSLSIAFQVEAGSATLHSWDTKIENASKRFQILTDFEDQAVLDQETGLVWQRSPDSGNVNWVSALAYCYTQEVGGRKGWRPPTIEELASLVDSSKSLPALPPGHPFLNIRSDFYWSQTTAALNTTRAWVVDIGNADVLLGAKDTLEVPVWCVRGGHAHDGQ